MSYAQMIEEAQYAEAARFDRFDGFDRGDLDTDQERDQGAKCIGRMAGEWGGKVEVFVLWDEGDTFYQVVVTNDTRRTVSVYERDTEAQAKEYARWWLAGCPA